MRCPDEERSTMPGSRDAQSQDRGIHALPHAWWCVNGAADCGRSRTLPPGAVEGWVPLGRGDSRTQTESIGKTAELDGTTQPGEVTPLFAEGNNLLTRISRLSVALHGVLWHPTAGNVNKNYQTRGLRVADSLGLATRLMPRPEPAALQPCPASPKGTWPSSIPASAARFPA